MHNIQKYLNELSIENAEDIAFYQMDRRSFEYQSKYMKIKYYHICSVNYKIISCTRSSINANIAVGKAKVVGGIKGYSMKECNDILYLDAIAPIIHDMFLELITLQNI